MLTKIIKKNKDINEKKYVLYLKVANLEVRDKVQVKLNIQKTRLAIK